jgi:hypothetical protein
VEVMLGAGVLLGVAIGVGILVLLVAIFVVVPRLAFRTMEPSLRRRIAATYAPDQIVLEDLKAVTLGLESRGVLQGRGNGALVLTGNELTWFRFVPESSDLRIPRESITKVDTVMAHLGKTYGRDLLRVTFMNDGKPDSMAWYVTDLGAWLSKLGEPSGTARET